MIRKRLKPEGAKKHIEHLLKDSFEGLIIRKSA